MPNARINLRPKASPAICWAHSGRPARFRRQGADVDRHHEHGNGNERASSKARGQNQHGHLQCEAEDIDRLHREPVREDARQHLHSAGGQVNQRHQHRDPEHAALNEISDALGKQLRQRRLGCLIDQSGAKHRQRQNEERADHVVAASLRRRPTILGRLDDQPAQQHGERHAGR